MPSFCSALLLAAAIWLAGGCAYAYTVNPACGSSSYANQIRLNEAKSQGGGTGLDFLEIYTTADNVSLNGWKIGVSGYTGSLPSGWTVLSSNPKTGTLSLGQSYGCIDYTGDKQSFSSCSPKDTSGSTWDYGRYILYELPNMSQQDGQFILLDPDGNAQDFVSFSSSAACSTSLYWAPPTGSCTNTATCAPNFASSNADLSRNVDATGSWQPGGSGSQGSSNTEGSPGGGAGYAFVASPTGLCTGAAQTVTLTAVWVDSSGAILTPQTTYTAYSGTGSAAVTGSAGLSTSSPLFSNGVASLGMNDSLAETVTLTVANPAIPGSSSNIPIAFATCASGLDHIRLEHDGSGVTCAREAVTLKACADAACSTLYSGNVSLTLAPSGWWNAAAGGSQSDSVSFNGSATYYLSHTSIGSVSLGAAAISPAPSNGYACYIGAGANCGLDFADAGLLFDVPHHPAETLQNVTVSAVKKADNSLACTPAFANVNKAVTFNCAYNNPATGTLPVRVGGIALNAGNNPSAPCGVGQAVTLAFNGSGIASTSVQYADVGQISLNASYSGSGSDAGLLMTGSDSFIAAPAAFGFSAISPAPIKAGTPFSATLSALNSAAAVTPNFGQETPSPEQALLTGSQCQPTGSQAVAGVLSNGGNIGGFSNGAATVNNLSWSEVGNIDLAASLASGNYLGSGLTAAGNTGSGSVLCNGAGNVGRFIPDHFTTSVTRGCPAGNFTYSGQPFAVEVSAWNGAATPAISKNYDGSAGTSPNFAQATTLSNAGSTSHLSNNSLAASAYSQGMANAGNVTYTMPTAQAPTTLTLRAVDNDNVSSAGFAEGSNAIRYGRLRLDNAYGSELLKLNVPIALEYWTGTAWSNNSLDLCSALTANHFSFSFPGPNLAACETALAVSGAAPNYTLELSAPGLGNNGQATLSPQLGSTAGGNQCSVVGGPGPAAVPANLPWLQYDWSGAGVGNPAAVAVFGIHKSNVIDLREIY
jgi:MSHA biogenesis protein MshQ